VIFVALLNDAPVGFTQLYPSWSSVSMRALWILNDLFVAQVARRRGVARALILRAEQYAMKLQAKGLVLETAVDNIHAQHLYENLGWKRDDEFYRYYRYF
jgi:ribosomal protein S18 acetylase RimI-like enzyme